MEATPGRRPDRQPELLAAVAAMLRGKGERMTTPRRAVLTALAEHPGHHTMEEVAALVAVDAPGVHRTSVYRTLVALSGLGVVQHVHLGHGATAYHLTGDDGPHLHAQCRKCGRICDLPSDLLADVAGRLEVEIGFTLDATHVALSGVCVDCSGAPSHPYHH